MRRISLCLLVVLCPSLELTQSGGRAWANSPSAIRSQNMPHSLSQGRSYNRHANSRVLAPKVKRYPVLDQLEHLLYPSQDFSKQEPRARLERLEIAVWGDKQKGSVATRLDKLQQEVDAWQIANQQVSDLLNQQTLAKDPYNKSHAYAVPEAKATKVSYKQPRQANYQPFVIQSNKRNKSVDYDYQNYRLVTPIIKNLGQRGVGEIFRRRN